MSESDDRPDGMLEQLAGFRVRALEMLRKNIAQMTERMEALTADAPERVELATWLREAQVLVDQGERETPAIDKRLAKLRRNRELVARRVTPRGERES